MESVERRRTIPEWRNDDDEAPPRSRPDRRLPKNRWPPSQRCIAHNRSGERCRKFALRGGRLCKWHSRGTYAENRKREVAVVQDVRELVKASKAAMENAQVDLRAAAPEAVRCLRSLVNDPDASPSVRARAAEILLKHSGVSMERSTLEIETRVVESDSRQSSMELIERRLEALAVAQAQQVDDADGDSHVVEAEPARGDGPTGVARQV